MATPLITEGLLGRRTWDKGVVRACFLDRGEVKLIVENPDGNLYETTIHGIHLTQEQDK